MLARLRSILEWFGSHGIVVLGGVLLIVAGTWGFLELLDEVREGEIQTWDDALLELAARYRGPDYAWLEEIGRDLTALGGIAVLTLLVVATCGYLLMVRKFHAMWLVIAATIGGLILSLVLKWAIGRDRPETFEHLSHVHTASFPSGHAMLSTIVYLTLGALLARIVSSRAIKLYFLLLAMLLAFLVGISRVYLTVHWPTDVLAGWLAGLVWAMLCWLVAMKLQQRGWVEQEPEQP